MHYRIALCGFSEFEYRAMHFSFQHPASPDDTRYDVVDALAEADFAVVDTDSKPAVKGVLLSNRIAHAVFVGAAPPPGAGLHLPRPIDPTRIRRLLDALSLRFPAPHVRLEPPPEMELPTLDDVVLPEVPLTNGHAFDLPAAAALMVELPPAPAAKLPATHAPSTEASAHQAAKAAARAAARRARQAQYGADPHPQELLRDVMVLDADDAAGAVLCALLDKFGFTAHRVLSISKAREQLAIRPYAAFFLDIALDGADRGEGLALLQRIQELPVPEGHAAAAVLMVTAQLKAADRVRAALAGIKVPLAKPVSRGDVARALEGCGVSLPADARGR